jgi:hypothetical protein
MGRWLTTRRSEWLPGVAIVGVATALAILLGSAIGTRSWLSYAGLVLALVLLFGWLERRHDERHRAQKRSRRSRGELKAAERGRATSEYDLSKDRSTDDQKYVM